LDDLRRKLDVEHTSISSKLEQGAAARQELQDLKGTSAHFCRVSFPATRSSVPVGKIMEDLELSKASLAKRLDKIENKARSVAF
jgi:phage terminase large subunit-like protein